MPKGTASTEHMSLSLARHLIDGHDPTYTFSKRKRHSEVDEARLHLLTVTRAKRLKMGYMLHSP